MFNLGNIIKSTISLCTTIGALLFSSMIFADLAATIEQETAAVSDQVIAWRRDIHQHP